MRFDKTILYRNVHFLERFFVGFTKAKVCCEDQVLLFEDDDASDN